MPRRLTVCSTPGCGEPSEGGRCSDCRGRAYRADADRRGSFRERTPDSAAYNRIRAELQARMDRGEPFWCWRCDIEINPEHWHLGHDDVDRSVIRGPECPPCNLATNTAGRATAHRG